MVEFFEAVGENGIEIGEEHDGSLVGLTKASDQIDRARGCHARLESALGSHLIDDPVGKWVGKRQT